MAVASGLLLAPSIAHANFSYDTSGEELYLRFLAPDPVDPWPFGDTAWAPVSAALGWDALYVDDLTSATPVYTTPPTVRFANGSNSTGIGLYINRNVGDLYGSMGTRVWDSNGNMNTGGVLMGTSITNNTGAPITSFSLGYTGEQWWARTGDDGTFNVSYSLDASNLGDGTWEPINELDYRSERTSTGNFSVNGRSVIREDNRRPIRPVVVDLDTPVQDGETLYLRWFSVNQPGVDQTIGFDEVRFVANPAPSVFNADLVIGTDADPNGFGWDYTDRIIDLGAGVGESGSLTVPAGESLLFYDLYMGVDGADASGTLTVDGVDAAVTLSRDTGFGGLVHVGVDGSGEILVTNEGSFEGNFLRVARNENSQGSITVSEGGGFHQYRFKYSFWRS